MTSTPIEHTLSVTLNGETREVKFVEAVPGRSAYAVGFAARIGNGTKLHRAEMPAWCRDGVWTVRMSTTVLNREARIVEFADKVPELLASRHLHSSIKAGR